MNFTLAGSVISKESNLNLFSAKLQCQIFRLKSRCHQANLNKECANVLMCKCANSLYHYVMNVFQSVSTYF